jgi:hypothetical protein
MNPPQSIEKQEFFLMQQGLTSESACTVSRNLALKINAGNTTLKVTYQDLRKIKYPALGKAMAETGKMIFGRGRQSTATGQRPVQGVPGVVPGYAKTTWPGTTGPKKQTAFISTG